MTFSSNDKLILSVHEQLGLEAEVQNSFATVKQKERIIGLKLLMDATLNSGITLRKGQTIYFDEETLHSPTSGARFIKKADFSEQKFIVMDFKQAIAVGE